MAMKFDINSIAKIVEKGLSHKLELIENAIVKLDRNLEPLSIVENFIFTANTKTGDLWRMRYDIRESYVVFSDPKKLEVDPTTDKVERETKRIVRNIVESLAEDNTEAVDLYKSQWLKNERQRYQLENKLNLTTGVKSQYIRNARTAVQEAVDSIRSARTLLKKAKIADQFSQLLEGKEVAIDATKTYISETKKQSNKKLQYIKLIEGRNAAKTLHESLVFSEYAKNLLSNDESDVNEAVDFIITNYHELFTLSIVEQVELFSTAADVEKDEAVKAVMKIGKAAVTNEQIAEFLEKLDSIIEASSGNFHERMQMIENEINSRAFALKDIQILTSVFEKILAQPSEFLAPEFVIECRKAYRRLAEMFENNNIDEAAVSAMIHLISNFYPQQVEGLGESTDVKTVKNAGDGKSTEIGAGGEGNEKTRNAEAKADGGSSEGEGLETEKNAGDGKSTTIGTGKGKKEEVGEVGNDDNEPKLKKPKKSEEDENANKTIYGDGDEDEEDENVEEAAECKSCGAKPCLCDILKEEKEEDESEEGEAKSKKEDDDEEECETCESFEELEARWSVCEGGSCSIEEIDSISEGLSSLKGTANAGDLEKIDEMEDAILLYKATNV